MAKSNVSLTAKRLRKLVSYDPETGILRWIESRGGQLAGSIVGCEKDGGGGYWLVRVDNKLYRAHRVIWLYVTGRWPKHGVDHIDGNRANNRFANLRDISQSGNLQNRKCAQRNNRTTKLLGVTIARDSKRTKPFMAKIAINGVTKHIGAFATPEEAHAAYVAAKRKLHPFGTL